jgi:hypothetical protein
MSVDVKMIFKIKPAKLLTFFLLWYFSPAEIFYHEITFSISQQMEKSPVAVFPLRVVQWPPQLHFA